MCGMDRISFLCTCSHHLTCKSCDLSDHPSAAKGPCQVVKYIVIDCWPICRIYLVVEADHHLYPRHGGPQQWEGKRKGLNSDWNLITRRK